MKIVLDTGCIDLFLEDRVKELSKFQKQIQEHELSGDDVCLTIINYAERMAGIKWWIEELKLPKKERENSAKEKRRSVIAKIQKFEGFFEIVKENKNILNFSYRTAEIYATLFKNVKLSVTKTFSERGLKCFMKKMHNDLWVASLCIENSCKLYTCDKNDFEKIKDIENALNLEIIVKE
jgi:predicted nucleic acid-binding protein